MSKPSGRTKKSFCSTRFPRPSCNCQAIWTHRGQLSVSVMGASHRLGRPVVSVSNIRYIGKRYGFRKQSIKIQKAGDLGEGSFHDLRTKKKVVSSCGLMDLEYICTRLKDKRTYKELITRVGHPTN